jgi:hypothetical protein
MTLINICILERFVISGYRMLEPILRSQVVKLYNATNSILRFTNKNYFSLLKKRSSLL